MVAISSILFQISTNIDNLTKLFIHHHLETKIMTFRKYFKTITKKRALDSTQNHNPFHKYHKIVFPKSKIYFFI